MFSSHVGYGHVIICALCVNKALIWWDEYIERLFLDTLSMRSMCTMYIVNDWLEIHNSSWHQYFCPRPTAIFKFIFQFYHFAILENLGLFIFSLKQFNWFNIEMEIGDVVQAIQQQLSICLFRALQITHRHFCPTEQATLAAFNPEKTWHHI